tara:strand:+ start:876 stop:2960 length:2085 start_codon:yes stop_codon:yes gene_type:complete
MRPEKLNFLFSSIGILKGVGPKLEKIINKLGINLNIHFLWHIPHNVIERKYYENIKDADLNTIVTLKIKILKHQPSRFKRQPYKVNCLCGENTLDIVFFNARHPVVRSMLPTDEFRLVSGKLEYFRNNYQINHPSHIVKISDLKSIKDKEPIYNLTAGLNQRNISKLTNQVLEKIPELDEWISKKYINKYNFYSWSKSILGIHNPIDRNDFKENNDYRKRLAFDELLAHQLAIYIIRNFNLKKKGISIKNNKEIIKKFIKKLPFELTDSQKKVIKEIDSNIESQNQMIRLLQGDVGSGKTIVALISMLKVIESGYQAALMVPTSILAYQHYENFCKLLKEFNIRITLLTGKDKGKIKLQKIEHIKNNISQIIIGTHSLIQEGVNFNKIGLAIIDEQHRFGVYQRMAFNYKGQKPDILVMSATPIPRTLTLAAYGDMEESKITQLPLNRKKIITSSLSLENEKNLIERISYNIKNSNSKFYWVCPLIEESEELDLKAAKDRYTNLKKLFKDKVLLIHGQLNEKEKENIMEKFKNQDYRILVATTVIEVGIDIKTATTIIIEHAERFGLAQLHQLRGRVGRNDMQSYCVLLHKKNINETAKKRINIMKKTNNGFEIAEEDLKIRGPGEILGKKQSGIPTFNIADLSFDNDLLEDARNFTNNIITEDPKLEKNNGKKLKNLLYIHERDAAIKTLIAG